MRLLNCIFERQSMAKLRKWHAVLHFDMLNMVKSDG